MSAITLGTTVLSCLPSGTGSARLPQYLLPSSTRVDEWWRHLGGTFKLVVGGWFVIALTIGVIGWIVRGFKKMKIFIGVLLAAVILDGFAGGELLTKPSRY